MYLDKRVIVLRYLLKEIVYIFDIYVNLNNNLYICIVYNKEMIY